MKTPNISGEIDPYSRTWQIIDRYLDGRLAYLRSALEEPQTEADTAGLRRAIRELRAFRNACKSPEPAPDIPPRSADPHSRGPLSY